MISGSPSLRCAAAAARCVGALDRCAASSCAGLLGIRLNALRRRLVEKDKRQGVAGLSRHIAAQARYRSRHATDVLRRHLAEAIALDGHLLSGFDLVVEPDQMLDEP